MPMPASDDDGAPLPDAAAEAAMLSELRSRGETATGVSARDLARREEAADPRTLPPLDDLVARVPAPVREKLDELFRARFVTVKKMPPGVFKAPPLN